MMKAIWERLNPYWMSFGTLCSIGSLLFCIFADQTLLNIAFLCVIAWLGILLWQIIAILRTYLDKPYPNDHKCVASFIKYTCNDGDNVIFETHKLIQAKCFLLERFNLGLKWSGDQKLQVESMLQDVEEFEVYNKDDKYDNAVLKLKNPVKYNDIAVIHCKTKVNDADHKSKPMVEVAVREPMDMIHICIELAYKETNPPARCSRRLIQTIVPREYDTITSIEFNTHTRQYEYCIPNPAPGFFYRIEWTR
jgi:hypothetical protein|nr:MAG TPA: hypothetical protein [Caudoviricetes sp.]